MSDTQGVVSQSPEPQAHDSKPLQGADFGGAIEASALSGFIWEKSGSTDMLLVGLPIYQPITNDACAP